MADGRVACGVAGAVIVGLLLIVILVPISFSDVEYYEVRAIRQPAGSARHGSDCASRHVPESGFWAIANAFYF